MSGVFGVVLKGDKQLHGPVDIGGGDRDREGTLTMRRSGAHTLISIAGPRGGGANTITVRTKDLQEAVMRK